MQHTDTQADIRFGLSLGGPENAALRARIEDLAATLDRPLVVDTVLALERRLREGSLAAPAPAAYLLFDLQHLFLYEERRDGAPRIDSALLHLLDGYPAQPFELLAEHFAEHPFQPVLPIESLDLLPVLWERAAPGRLTALGLTTGHIETTPVTLHPHAAGVEPPPYEPRELCGPFVDASLRQKALPDLDGFVSRSCGVVRNRQTMWGYMSLPVSTALVMWNRGRRQELSFGKGFREPDAAAVAVCESLERFQIACRRHGEELVRGSYRELAAEALDPRELFYGRSACCPEDRLPDFDENAPLSWTRARSPFGDEILVPAQEVWFDTSAGDPELIGQTTSGCALGSSLEEASLFALLEAIERDAYLLMWYLRRPCPEIDPDSIEDEAFQLLRRRWELELRNHSFRLFDLTTDTAVPAVAAVAVRRRGNGRKTFHGAAARLSAGRACLVALEDIASFSHRLAPESRRRGHHLLDHPDDILGPEDHGSVYALDAAFERLAFLDAGGGARLPVREVDRHGLLPPAGRYDLRETLQRLARHLETCGVRVYFKDITHPAVAEKGLCCVKAITPGLYPLWFGHRKRRFGITPRLERLGGPPPYNLEVHPFV